MTAARSPRHRSRRSPRTHRALLASAVLGLAAGVLAPIPSAHAAASAPVVERVHGPDRYLTGAALAQRLHTGTGGTVLLATGASFPDALAAGPVGPVLLVRRDRVPDAVRRELQRLRPDRLLVVGGAPTVGDAVLSAVRGLAPEVRRVQGRDRFATAAAVSALTAPTGSVVHLASGEGFADAVAASAAAGRAGGPLLLTRRDAVPSATLAELRRLRPRQVVVAGGTSAVSGAVLARVGEIAPVVRVHGRDRYATAAALATRGGGSAGTVLVATGRSFPDALVAGSAARRLDAPLLLTGSGLPGVTAGALRTLGAERVVVAGAAAAVPSAVVTGLRQALGGGAGYADRPLALPGYAYSSRPPGAADLARMRSSHRAGCPVASSDLRLLELTYAGFDGDAHTGEMVVHRSVAPDVVAAFRAAYAARFSIARMELVDAFGGSDDASMAANNTSAYNCRRTTSGAGWSEHAYGRAVDVNPVQNPYVSGSTVLPAAGRSFLDRRARPGVLRAGDPIVGTLTARGWGWGGSWRTLKDYQHLSRSGR